MVGGGYGCVRAALCLLNTVMWLAGCGLLGVGLWLRLSYGGYATLLPEYQGLSVDGLCLAAGTVTAVVALCGCCGAGLQHRCLLMTYFCTVAFAFLLELVAVTLCFVFRTQLSEMLVSELHSGLRHQYNSTNSLGVTWDHIQLEFSCCGIQSYTDWYSIQAWPNSSHVPDSCCLPWFRQRDTEELRCGASGRPSHWYQEGCYSMISLWLLERLHVIGISALVLSFIQLFGLISSMLLFCTIGYSRRKKSMYHCYELTS